MITEAEALAQIMESVEPLAAHPVPLAQARERFAARDLFARIALPGFDNSAMDCV